ncbi:MAG: 2-amino-4-hydroxy-6-hydroxymethyldihydropteridine diphosphokinase [Planctomycetota bacterium]
MNQVTTRYSNVIAYIGLGSNLGDKKNNLRQAIRRISGINGIRVLKTSRFCRTAPEGFVGQPCFLNAVASINTNLAPDRLLAALKLIEKIMGREKQVRRWGPRVIDLDILLYGDAVIKTGNLTIPHPLMHKRGFVLDPLCQLAPGLKHPVSRKPIRKLLELCR